MNIITLTEPPVEPVTLAELYLALKEEPEGSPPTHPRDEDFSLAISAARIRAEQITRRAFVRQQLRVVYPSFTACALELRRPPLIELVQVRYYDEDNALQTLSASVYVLEESLLVPRLVLADGQEWPTTYARADAVQIDYFAGYPTTGSPITSYVDNIPAAIKRAILIDCQMQLDSLAPEQRTQLEQTLQRLLASFHISVR